MKIFSNGFINWKKLDLAASMGALLLMITLFWTAPHWWKKVREAQST